MTSKWASIPIDGGSSYYSRSPSLSRSVSKSVTAVASIPIEAISSPFNGWSSVGWLFIAVVIAVIIAVSSRGTYRSLGSVTKSTPVGHIVDVSPGPVEPTVEPTVEPKSVGPIMVAPIMAPDMWNQAVDLRDEPYLQSENGQTFAEFQKAFLERGIQKPMIEAKASAKQPFFDANMLNLEDVPEAALMAFEDNWPDTNGPSVFGGNAEVTDMEARQIAQEAFQTVPLGAQPEAVAEVLKEILAARNEAARLGLNLPEAPEEQKQNIKHWSKRSGPAAILAKTILSRV